MRKSPIVYDQPTFDDVESELSLYLTLRYKSEGFAKKILHELHARIDGTDILSVVSDVRVYLCSLAISIANQWLNDTFENGSSKVTLY